MAKASWNGRKIVISPRLRETSDRVLEVIRLEDRPPTIFAYRGVLVRLRDRDGVSTEMFTVTSFRGKLDRLADWEKPGSGGKLQAAKPPIDVVNDVLSLGDWPEVPVLEGVVHGPVVAKDGTLLKRRGYDKRTGLFLDIDPGLVIPPVRSNPSRRSVRAAVRLFDSELFADFPFAGPADRAHAFGLALLPIVKPYIDDATPLHLILSAAPSTGKSHLASAALIPGRGRPLVSVSDAGDDNEWRRTLTGLIAQGTDALLLDNVSHLNSSALASGITSPSYAARQVGTNRMIGGAIDWIWVATANNPRLSHEMASRTVPTRLDATAERMWKREFRYEDLWGWARANRGALLAALLTMVRAWFSASCPPGELKHSRFPAWSQVIGGILLEAGVKGFLTNLDELHETSDFESKGLGILVPAWQSAFGTGRVGVSELLRIVDSFDVDFFDLGTGPNRRIKFGKQMAGFRGRVVGEFKIGDAGTYQNAQQYRLEEMKQGGES